MASKARARAELNLKHLPYNWSEYEKNQARDQAFKAMLKSFKRRCKEYDIAQIYKNHQYFESKPDKDKRKRKEALIRRLDEEKRQKNGPDQRKDNNKGENWQN